jgi:hypothetical protein
MTYPNQLAYPFSYEEEYGDHGYKRLTTHNGLTKREYFAALAMQGMLCNPRITELMGSNIKKEEDQYAFIVESSTKMSDALIAELNKEK